MSKGDMNPVMYSILKMVEYKLQIITFQKKFHDLHTHLLVTCPNPLKVKDTDVLSIYCAFED